MRLIGGCFAYNIGHVVMVNARVVQKPMIKGREEDYAKLQLIVYLFVRVSQTLKAPPLYCHCWVVRPPDPGPSIAPFGPLRRQQLEITSPIRILEVVKILKNLPEDRSTHWSKAEEATDLEHRLP